MEEKRLFKVFLNNEMRVQSFRIDESLNINQILKDLDSSALVHGCRLYQPHVTLAMFKRHSFAGAIPLSEFFKSLAELLELKI